MIAVVDPGLANTGVLITDGKSILAGRTFSTPGDGYRTDFSEAVRRSLLQAGRIVACCMEHDVTLAVVESYRDIPGALRGARNRWTTPLMIGVLAAHLEVAGISDVWQDPEKVMRAYKEATAMWERGYKGIIAGDECVTNAHLRSAGAHMLAYIA